PRGRSLVSIAMYYEVTPHLVFRCVVCDFWRCYTDDEEIPEGGIPQVIVLGYNGLSIQPVAPPSLDYIPGLKDPQTPLVPQDKDEHEPMFVHAHDPDYVLEPIYPE
ncbi:hypothetical protein Tco_0447195, partial [Tanacetum coccineum]